VKKTLNSRQKNSISGYKIKTSKILIDQITSQAIKSTTRHYDDTLPAPKLMTRETYISGWVQEALKTHVVTTDLKQHQPTPGFIDSIKNLFELLPDHLLTDQTIRATLFTGAYTDRVQAWNKLNLPVSDIQDRFIKLSQFRVKQSHISGFTSYQDMMLTRLQVPVDKYKFFLSHVDQVIDILNQHLPSSDLPDWFFQPLNTPCAVCQLPTFPFDHTDQVLDYVLSHYPSLQRIKHKLDIRFTPKESTISYNKEVDQFDININSSFNLRHQSLSLIHELSHAICFLSYFDQSVDWQTPSQYQKEQDAYTQELKILQSISDDLYQATSSEILLVLTKVLFELELYKNSDQDLTKLYAQTYNRCFKRARQTDNPTYLLNHSIVMHPFDNLHHAISIVSVIHQNNIFRLI
jgi:hypothetical protein